MLVSIVTMSENYPEIWDDFAVPDHVDRQTVIDSILIGCAEMELLYSDPDILKYMIRTWTRRDLPVWEGLQATLEYKYNPIWNVEGSETMEITRHDLESRDLKNVRTPELTNRVKVAGYNSEDPALRDEVEESGKDTNDHTGTVDQAGSEKRVFTRGMNLGVMTTQQLIREQRELVQFTVADFIFNSFKSNFCLMVY